MAGIGRDFKFRRLLHRVGESLLRQDLDSLVFMCRDVIPLARMERVRSPTDLWQALSERGKLTKDDLSYLALLMSSIGKENLLGDFEAHGFPVVTAVKDADYQFQESILKVAHNLTSTEVKELAHLFQDYIKLIPDKVFSATQLFQMLLQRQVISLTNLHPLFYSLVAIGRSDLTNYFSHYLPPPCSSAFPTAMDITCGKSVCHLLEYFLGDSFYFQISMLEISLQAANFFLIKTCSCPGMRLLNRLVFLLSDKDHVVLSLLRILFLHTPMEVPPPLKKHNLFMMQLPHYSHPQRTCRYPPIFYLLD